MATGLTRWRPFAELEDLRGRIERMFAEVENGEPRKWGMALDVIERDDRYVLRADVPGVQAGRGQDRGRGRRAHGLGRARGARGGEEGTPTSVASAATDR